MRYASLTVQVKSCTRNAIAAKLWRIFHFHCCHLVALFLTIANYSHSNITHTQRHTSRDLRFLQGYLTYVYCLVECDFMFYSRLDISLSWRNLVNECNLTLNASVNSLRLYTAKTYTPVPLTRLLGGTCSVKWKTAHIFSYSKVQAQKGGRGIALPTLDPGTRKGWVISATLQQFYPRGIEPVLILQEGEWALGPENLAATWVRSPDH